MEYSREDSLRAWEANADFWDSYMGDQSNQFHREAVRPGVTELLDPRPGDFILDAACGNGNYSAYLAERGARVVAFDYSPRMIKKKKKRRSQFAESIEFLTADAADEQDLMGLRRDRPYDKAVSNMAVMDISDAAPLFRCVGRLLAPGGIFVFATQHPCFVTLTDRYLTPHAYYGEAIGGQPQKQCYYHRSMQDIFALCFQNGFVIDGFYERTCEEKEIPDVIIVRARLGAGDASHC